MSLPYREAHSMINEASRVTGQRYQNLYDHCSDMSGEALKDLIRLIRDMKHVAQREKQEAQSEKNKRRRGQFWG
jgi:uncharacterized membrane-anchored protein YhcB (DUF1043 family)